MIKNKLIALENTGIVLQKMYESEINLRLVPFWDAGWEIYFGDDMGGWTIPEHRDHDNTKIDQVISVAAECACNLYPDSEFKKWFDSFKNESDFETCARPLIKYLNDHHHPHAKAIVTIANAEVVEGVKITGPIEDYFKD